MGILNLFVKPILIILTLPITIFTFGLFLFVINALIILLAAKFVNGFRVDGFWWALLFSLLLSVLTSFLYKKSTQTGNLTKQVPMLYQNNTGCMFFDRKDFSDQIYLIYTGPFFSRD